MLLLLLAVVTFATQSLPPNIIENGDARGGQTGWYGPENNRNVTIEDCEGGPCFVLRNGVAWRQFSRLPPESAGKFVVMVARASSERVLPGGNITGLPAIRAAFAVESRNRYLYVDDKAGKHIARPPRVNYWTTISTVVQIPPEAAFLWASLQQGTRKGTPHDGSAARFMDVEARIFEAREQALAYVKRYDSRYEPGKRRAP